MCAMVTFKAESVGRRFIVRIKGVGQLEFSVSSPSWQQVCPLLQNIRFLREDRSVKYIIFLNFIITLGKPRYYI